MHTNPTHNDGSQELLERYLDGLLSESERAAFEARAKNEPELRSQIELQGELRSGLFRLYREPGVRHGPVIASGTTGQPAKTARHRRLFLLLGAAAVVAIAAVVVWMQNGEGDASRDRLFAEYNRVVAKGFVPAEVCTTDQEFVKWTDDRFKHPLRPVHPPAGSTPVVTLVGWDHTPLFSYYTGLLLARVDGKPVVVVMDPSVEGDKMPTEKHSGQPRLFSRKVGGVWLFEITPLDKPSVIPLIEPAK
jgi:hypothetical protein